MHILDKITETIAEPRADLKDHAPRIETMTIPKEFIGAIIGPGGKIIQGMQEETGATITIEEVDGVGRIEIAGTNKKCIDDAMRIIKGIVAVPEVGEVYVGKIRSIMPYGAFVEFLSLAKLSDYFKVVYSDDEENQYQNWDNINEDNK